MATQIRHLHLGDYTRDLAANHGDTKTSAYHTHTVMSAVPAEGGWRDVNVSFWEMGLEFARHLREAANVSVATDGGCAGLVNRTQHESAGAEEQLPPFLPEEDGARRRSQAYIFENALRSAIPAFERLLCVRILFYSVEEEEEEGGEEEFFNHYW
jgi:hypothetical protein